jgi:hypothetical protein
VESRDIATSEYKPRSPKEVANIQQVRRVSQYKDTQASDKKSNRSSSQHNIHITIESSVEGEPTPTITISPNSKHRAEYAQNISAIRVANCPPQPILSYPRPANIAQTVVHQSSPSFHVSPQPVIVNSPPTFVSHHPIFIQSQPPNNAASSSPAELTNFK